MFFNSIENYGRSLLIKIHGENKTHPDKKADPTLSAIFILSQPSITPSLCGGIPKVAPVPIVFRDLTALSFLARWATRNPSY